MSKELLKTLLVLILAVPALFFTSCDDDDDTPDPQTIVEYAQGDDNFESLVAALTRAGLVSTLEGAGPYTVFAPTDAAFDQLLTDLGVASLDDVDATLLAEVLKYHVVSGKVMAADLTDGYVSTLADGPEGTKLSANIRTTGGVSINGAANVTTADVDVSNGVIHVIDAVLSRPTIASAAADAGFNSLLAALTRAGLATSFDSPDDDVATVFAPTDAAFAILLGDLNVTDIDQIPVPDLTSVLANHVTGGNVTASELSDGQTVITLNTMTDALKVNIDSNGEVTLDAANSSAKVEATDVQTINGVVHVISAVLKP